MDTLIKSLSNDGHIRTFVLKATEEVARAQTLHNTMASSTVALGRTLMVAQILAANEKGKTTITLKILGDGGLGAILAVAKTNGSVKGYVQYPDADYRKTATGDIIVGPLVGEGQFLVITDYGFGTPYHSMTPLVTGEIGQDFAYYLTDSQQTPSAVGLDVLLDDADHVLAAGGFLIQLLPDATESDIHTLENNLAHMAPLHTYLAQEEPQKALLDALYGDRPYSILEETTLRFRCDCSRERFLESLASLPPEEIAAMIAEDGGAEIICHFCQTPYHFTQEDLEELCHDH